MRRIYIALDESAFCVLQRRALDERRDVRRQAAVELERLLTPAGAKATEDVTNQLPRLPAEVGA